jgi:hypothetical protein
MPLKSSKDSLWKNSNADVMNIQHDFSQLTVFFHPIALVCNECLNWLFDFIEFS